MPICPTCSREIPPTSAFCAYCGSPTRAFMPSLCPAFTDSAVAFARSLTSEPAQKGGRPVRAWVRLPVRARTP